jgi:nicotinate-nucleotide adenylyltransferase
MKIGILGGSFDPPQNAHRLVADQALSLGYVDRVWLLVNYGHKYFGIEDHKKTASANDRMAMTRFLETDGIQVSTIEIDHQTSGQTIEMVQFLPEDYEFFFLIGSDCLPDLPKWKNYEILLQKMHFLVCPRAGYPIIKEYLHPGIQVMDHEDRLVVTNLSSSMVRDRVARGEPIDDLVHPKVKQYIDEHGLYRKER